MGKRQFDERDQSARQGQIRQIGKWMETMDPDQLDTLFEWCQEMVNSPSTYDQHTSKNDDKAEEQKVAAKFSAFSEHAPRGTTTQDIVAGFRAARKHNPGLTAEQFLGR